ncbi:MAG: S-methyl-5'-thioadenosine phosphorylase [Actinomycetota bacterium]|jgi:5'-methylthioadenosine phosphorylase|nr:S-methyl-5'-thioadenosine phosphorylase [Actinomycetota bacterium]MDA8167298.1 S-methyl-5'-thioadenosine phosphorylase [Actinomycetota bacterium]
MAGRIGVIGGSGFYELLENPQEMQVTTPFGDPSDVIALGKIAGREVCFLPRHGKGHRIMPTDLPFQANILALKQLGVEWIISASAVGSMKEEIKPGDIVIPDQFIDRTRQRRSTFFGDGCVAHISFADPVCGRLAAIVAEAGRHAGATIHEGGTYVCMEGPQFSTRAESLVYRSWGVDVIGMTNLQEAKLAREAEICYATMALATDYDCWYEGEEDVTIAQVIETMNNNVDMAKKIVETAVPRIPETRTECGCATAMQYGVMTDPAAIPAATKEKLKDIIGKYIP